MVLFGVARSSFGAAARRIMCLTNSISARRITSSTAITGALLPSIGPLRVRTIERVWAQWAAVHESEEVAQNYGQHVPHRHHEHTELTGRPRAFLHCPQSCLRKKSFRCRPARPSWTWCNTPTGTQHSGYFAVLPAPWNCARPHPATSSFNRRKCWTPSSSVV